MQFKVFIKLISGICNTLKHDGKMYNLSVRKQKKMTKKHNKELAYVAGKIYLEEEKLPFSSIFNKFFFSLQ